MEQVIASYWDGIAQFAAFAAENTKGDDDFLPEPAKEDADEMLLLAQHLQPLYAAVGKSRDEQLEALEHLEAYCISMLSTFVRDMMEKMLLTIQLFREDEL
jgi:hypothetical protein